MMLRYPRTTPIPACPTNILSTERYPTRAYIMGKVHEFITEPLADWLRKQHIFFVATAPASTNGFVNCSPKGGDAFRILGNREVAFQDLTGSGVETIAHLRENGRIVLMFCAFDGPPQIVRLHGTGTLLTPEQTQYATLIDKFPANVGTRAIIHIQVHRVSSSCGYAVPRFEYQEDRDVLDKWAINKGTEQLQVYRTNKNTQSINGLPALDPETAKNELNKQ